MRSDPLYSSAIRSGHHQLLETLRELIADSDRPQGLDPESLRAALAFLRQGLVPFARREEHSLAPDGIVWESVAFEHAFLEAEIDRFCREAAALLRGDPLDRSERQRSALEVRRTLCRIEAVLELHVLKEDDRGISAVRTGTAQLEMGNPPAEEDPSSSNAWRAMDSGEIEQFLSSHRWGILCTVGEGRPYGVPVSYGFDGSNLFIATRPGRKADNLDANRAVCFTVTEVGNDGRWRSVVVTGNAEWLERIPDHMAAVWALARQAHRTGLGREWRRLPAARLLRVDSLELTGRRRGR